MPLDPSTVSIVIPVNDYESKIAHDLLLHLKTREEEPVDLDVRRQDLPWAKAAAAGAELETEHLRDNVILVELPSPALEERLRGAGKQVFPLDHHLWARSGEKTLDRRHGLSAIEQLFQLIDLPINKEDLDALRLAGANDWGYIPALYAELQRQKVADVASGVKRIREEELAIVLGSGEAAAAAMADAMRFLDTAERDGALRVLGTGRGKAGTPDENDLILVKARASLSPCLLDALYVRRYDGFAKTPNYVDVLQLYHADDDPDRLVKIELSARPVWLDLIKEVMAKAEAPDGVYTRLNLWAGGSQAPFLGAEDKTGVDAKLLSELADELLDNLLIGNRPLLAWRTSFFQPLRYETDTATLCLPDHAVFDQAEDRQDEHYFLPALKEFVAPVSPAEPGDKVKLLRDQSKLRSYRLPELERLELAIEPANGRPRLCFKLSRARLHLFYDNTAVIEWEVGEKPESFPQSGAFWERLLADRAGSPTLAQVLDFNAWARFCYSSYVTIKPEDWATIRLVDGLDHADKLVFGEAVSDSMLVGWFKAFASMVLGQFDIGVDRCTVMGDERARVLTSVVAAGQQPGLPAGRREMQVMLARLQTVDPFATYHVSDPPFARRELDSGQYKRFAGYGSHFLASSHSFAFLGFVSDKDWSASFPYAIIHAKHMAWLYRRMFLLAQLYNAILNAFAVQIGRDSAQENRRDVMQSLRSRFLEFSNGLWFEQVSSQIQGLELFDLMTRQTTIRRDHDVIKEELERLDEYHRALIDEQRAENEANLAHAGVGLAVLAGVIGVFSIVQAWMALEWQGAFGAIGIAAFTIGFVALLAGLIFILTPRMRTFILASWRSQWAAFRRWIRWPI